MEENLQNYGTIPIVSSTFDDLLVTPTTLSFILTLPPGQSDFVFLNFVEISSWTHWCLQNISTKPSVLSVLSSRCLSSTIPFRCCTVPSAPFSNHLVNANTSGNCRCRAPLSRAEVHVKVMSMMHIMHFDNWHTSCPESRAGPSFNTFSLSLRKDETPLSCRLQPVRRALRKWNTNGWRKPIVLSISMAFEFLWSGVPSLPKSCSRLCRLVYAGLNYAKLLTRVHLGHTMVGRLMLHFSTNPIPDPCPLQKISGHPPFSYHP